MEVCRMILNCIGSDSSGNGYILDSGSEQLLIECGMPFRMIEKELNFNISGIVGLCLSHEHSDHAKYAREYAHHGIKVCSTTATLDAVGIPKSQRKDLEPKAAYRFGGFLVVPFRTQHDAADPCGFLINCPDGNRIVFATDTYYLKYTFPRVDYFMIECNYSKSKLLENVEEGIVHPSVAKRIRESHMSLDRCIETLKANDLSHTKAIILLHLSQDNSASKDYILNKVQQATGKAVYIAEKSTKIHLL